MDEIQTIGSEYAQAAAITFSEEVEGGLANLKGDSGGLTKYGISSKAYPGEDITNLTLDRAKFLAKRDYWFPMRLDTVNCQALANTLFDFAIHAGVRTVTKKLQFVMAKHFGFTGKIDGIAGSQTIDYLNKIIGQGQGAAWRLHIKVVKARMEFYVAVAPPEWVKGFMTRALRFV
jgi:lysozyme family protein